MSTEFITQATDGSLDVHAHPGQSAALTSTARFIVVLAGSQSGKTVTGPLWLWQEIRDRGPGDYLVVTPTYPLLALKAHPTFVDLFKRKLRLGHYRGSPTKQFRFTRAGEEATFGEVQDVPTNVFFGHAGDPDSLEAATAKAAWLDEAGQPGFKLGSWEAINRRLAIHQGRILVTTTPYSGLSWLKPKLYDPWDAARQRGERHPDIDVINFDSTLNPAFPPAEFERARRELPPWKFDLFFRGIFTRPAGLVYDSFDEARDVEPPFTPPRTWPRYLGLDFGGVNTAGVFLAVDPGTDVAHLYREYHAGSRTAAQHAAALLQGEPGFPTKAVGGSGSEGQWRAEFRVGGLPVSEPDVTGPDSVEVGINRVYGAIAQGKLRVASNCTTTLAQLRSYSRKVDASGNVTEDIEAKSEAHHMDALRYIGGWLWRTTGKYGPAKADPQRTSFVAGAPAGVFMADRVRRLE